MAALISLWLGIWVIMTIQKKNFTNSALTLMESFMVNTETAEHPALPAGLQYILIHEDRFIDQIGDSRTTAPGLTAAIRNQRSGRGWVSNATINGKDWIIWRKNGQTGQTGFIRSSENDLLKMVGFPQYNRLLMVCAGLASALLVLFMIWAVSWLRITTIQQLMLDEKG